MTMTVTAVSNFGLTDLYMSSEVSRLHDPVHYLPAEIFDKVLEFVSFPAIVTLREVCRDWDQAVSEFLETNRHAFRHLDFRNYDLDRVTPEVLHSCIQKAGGQTVSVLFACQSTKNAHFSTLRALILLHQTLAGKSFYLRLQNMKSRRSIEGTLNAELPELRGLAIDNLYFIIRQWYDYGIGDTSILNRLEELHISAHALPMLFAYIRTRCVTPLFPRLRVLRCGSDYEARRRLDVPHWLAGAIMSEDLVAFPDLLEFRIGDIPSGGGREQDLDQDCLDIVPQWMPRLQILTCRGVDLRPSRYPRREFVHRIDLRQARNLVELDLSYTKTWIMPFVSPKCEKLILRGAGFGAVDLSNSVLHGPDAVDGPVEQLETISEQFRGLHTLDLSSCGAVLTNSALIRILSLCNKDRLTTLSLQSCLRLEFGKYLTELMEQITELCPNLRWLSVSKNSSVSDADLEAVAELSGLEHLDLSGTSVTDNGLRRFYKTSSPHSIYAAGGFRQEIDVITTGCPDVKLFTK
ncbi:hypothetical protein V1512DRAFT_257344 [Lipomyces arxii]|uniref:uncharacterized protein n=1 Tax=Lipomyces arxii TaxID=56418 RepID=UPI0034CD1621